MKKCGLQVQGKPYFIFCPAAQALVEPDGNRSVNMETLARQAYAKGLYISDGKAHRYPGYDANAIRIGFASASKEELEQSIAILRKLL